MLKVRTRLEVVRPIVSRDSITRRQKTPGKAGDARLPGLNSVFGKQPHAGDRRLVRDGHEGAGGMVQFMRRYSARHRPDQP